jgi:hypothetical protein
LPFGMTLISTEAAMSESNQLTDTPAAEPVVRVLVQALRDIALLSPDREAVAIAAAALAQFDGEES